VAKYLKAVLVCTGVLILLASAGLFYITLVYPLEYKDIITANAREHNIDPKLVASVINTESRFNAECVSNKGAVGLMQVMPSTAEYMVQKYGLPDGLINLYDPAANIAIGTQYLAYLIKRFADTPTALFAYNAGEGNVSGWLSAENAVKLTSCPFAETNAYVKKVLYGTKFYKYRI
jgi:soluble lytic murein transglycosylase